MKSCQTYQFNMKWMTHIYMRTVFTPFRSLSLSRRSSNMPPKTGEHTLNQHKWNSDRLQIYGHTIFVGVVALTVISITFCVACIFWFQLIILRLLIWPRVSCLFAYSYIYVWKSPHCNELAKVSHQQCIYGHADKSIE